MPNQSMILSLFLEYELSRPPFHSAHLFANAVLLLLPVVFVTDLWMLLFEYHAVL